MAQQHQKRAQYERGEGKPKSLSFGNAVATALQPAVPAQIPRAAPRCRGSGCVRRLQPPGPTCARLPVLLQPQPRRALAVEAPDGVAALGLATTIPRLALVHIWKREEGAQMSFCCQTKLGYCTRAKPTAFITAYFLISNFSVPIRKKSINQYKAIPLVTCTNT